MEIYGTIFTVIIATIQRLAILDFCYNTFVIKSEDFNHLKYVMVFSGV
jgi:hypothetical protein